MNSTQKLNPIAAILETFVFIGRSWRELVIALIPAALVFSSAHAITYHFMVLEVEGLSLARFVFEPLSFFYGTARSKPSKFEALWWVGGIISFAVFAVPVARKICWDRDVHLFSFAQLATLRFFVSLLYFLSLSVLIFFLIVIGGWRAIQGWVWYVEKDPVVIEGMLPFVALSVFIGVLIVVLFVAWNSFVPVRAALDSRTMFSIRGVGIRGSYFRLVAGILLLMGFWFLFEFGVLMLATNFAGSSPPTNEVIKIFPRLELNPCFPDYVRRFSPTPVWVSALERALQLFEYVMLWVLVCVAYRRVVMTSTSDH